MLLMNECQITDKNSSWSMCKMINVWHSFRPGYSLSNKRELKCAVFSTYGIWLKGVEKKTFDEDEDWVNYKLDNLVYSDQKVRKNVVYVASYTVDILSWYIANVCIAENTASP